VPDYANWLKTPWRTQKDIDAVVHPPGVTDPAIIRPPEGRGITFRGFRPDIHVYLNPFGAPDPGQPEVVVKFLKASTWTATPRLAASRRRTAGAGSTTPYTAPGAAQIPSAPNLIMRV
jgi:hypothetical protein